MMKVFSKVLVVIFCPIMVVTMCASGQIVDSQGRINVPAAEHGFAEVPLINAYNPDRLIANKKARCQVQYDSKGVLFNFTVPCPENYKPNGSTVRDDSKIWSESDRRVEVFLQAKKGNVFSHYIVNSAGGVFDEKGYSPAWNGKAEIKRSVEGSKLKISIKVPFTDIGFKPSKANRLYGNAVVESLDPKDKYSITWTAVGPTFVNASAFGELRLAEAKPFVSDFDVSKVNYDKDGANLFLKYHVKNPGSKAVDVKTAQSEAAVQAGGMKVLIERVKLLTEKKPIVTFNIKDVFNYRHQVTNRLVPDVQFIAWDWETVSIRIRNLAYLKKFANTVRVERKGKKIYAGSIGDLELKRIDIGSWPVGDHVIEFSFTNPEGRVIIESQEKVTTIKPKKYDYDIANLDVSKLYKPISLKNQQLNVALSKFDLSAGALPKQIVVNGRSTSGKNSPICDSSNILYANVLSF